MAGKELAALSPQELQQEISELESARAALTRDKQIYRRLGFSVERINLKLRRLEARHSACVEALKRAQMERREQAAGLRSAGARYESSPL